jgi:hypothetical protein
MDGKTINKSGINVHLKEKNKTKDQTAEILWFLNVRTHRNHFTSSHCFDEVPTDFREDINVSYLLVSLTLLLLRRYFDLVKKS